VKRFLTNMGTAMAILTIVVVGVERGFKTPITLAGFIVGFMTMWAISMLINSVREEIEKRNKESEKLKVRYEALTDPLTQHINCRCTESFQEAVKDGKLTTEEVKQIYDRAKGAVKITPELIDYLQNEMVAQKMRQEHDEFIDVKISKQSLREARDNYDWPQEIYNAIDEARWEFKEDFTGGYDGNYEGERTSGYQPDKGPALKDTAPPDGETGLVTPENKRPPKGGSAIASSVKFDAEHYRSEVLRLERERDRILEWVMMVQKNSEKMSFAKRSDRMQAIAWGAQACAFKLVYDKIVTPGDPIQTTDMDSLKKNIEIASSENPFTRIKELLKKNEPDPRGAYPEGIDLDFVHLDKFVDLDADEDEEDENALTCPECGSDLIPYEPEEKDRFKDSGYEWKCGDKECETIWMDIDHIKRRKAELDAAGMKAKRVKKTENAEPEKTKATKKPTKKAATRKPASKAKIVKK